MKPNNPNHGTVFLSAMYEEREEEQGKQAELIVLIWSQSDTNQKSEGVKV